jgi:DNA polymerase III delta subunit
LLAIIATLKAPIKQRRTRKILRIFRCSQVISPLSIYRNQNGYGSFMSQKDKTNVAWIYGSYHQSLYTLQRIRQKYAHAESYVIDNNNKFADLYNLITSTSCFHACRLIVITDLPDMTDSESKILREQITKLDSTNLLVFS